MKRLNRDELQLFKEITSSTSDRRDYQDKTLDYYQTFYDSFGDKVEFMIATLNFEHYLAILQSKHNDLQSQINPLIEKVSSGINSAKVNKQISQLNLQISKLSIRINEAKAVLQEYMMLETIKRGIPKYNFLGIQGIFDGSDGVLRFKQNFNGYIVRKMGTFRYYPNPLKYKMISLIKKLLGRS